MHVIGCKFCLEPFQPLNVLASNKDIYVLTYFTLFIENAISQSDVTFPERIERVANRLKVAGQLQFNLAAGIALEMTAKMNSNRLQILYALTQQISGSEPSIIFHESPSLCDANSFPFLVPKKMLSPTEATASRKITSYASFCGRPFVSGCQDLPSSRVR